MALTIDDYIAMLKTNERRILYKIELLRTVDESVYDTITDYAENDSGTLTVNFNEGVRRTCNIKLHNFNKRFFPIVDALTIGSKVAVSLGYEINGEQLFFPQGVFIVDSPSVISDYASRMVEFSASDKFSALNGTNGGTFPNTFVAPSGSKISSMVRTLLALNIVNDPKDPIIDSSVENATIPYTITKEAGANVSDLILELALASGCYVYYDIEGVLNFVPIVQDLYKGAAYRFAANDPNFLTATRKYDYANVFNSVFVMAENLYIAGATIYYEAVNNDPADPNSVVNLGRKKSRKVSEYTAGITTAQLAQIRAEWELQNSTRTNSTMDVACLPLFHLQENQIVVVNNEWVGADDERFLINSISFTIGTGLNSSMNIVKALN